jgi:hypothetical protein
MRQSFISEKVPQMKSIKPLILLMAMIAISAGIASATENGGSVWPLGAESFATAAGVPYTGQTMFYQYDLFYVANELDDANGHDSGVPDFRLRVFAGAGKLSHNWGLKLLGGELGSYIAVPYVYEQFRVSPAERYSKADLTNIDIAPVTIFNHRGIVHWYYELQFVTLASGYQKGAEMNIGEHNIALIPAVGISLTPHKGAQNLMSRFDYAVNDADHVTHYHSGNEFFWHFDGQQTIPFYKTSVGVAGYFYQQVTNDSQYGAAVVTTNADGTKSTGYKGRVLEIGPQATLPCGKYGVLIFKWNHDFLVQNKTRGNAFWFELGLPFSVLHHAPGNH